MVNDTINKMARKLYRDLKKTNKYSVKLYGSKVVTRLYVSPKITAATPSPLSITMTCDTSDEMWRVIIANAPQLSETRINAVIRKECLWLALYSHTYEYTTFQEIPYMILAIPLGYSLYIHFAERVLSLDHMLHTLFYLPTNGSSAILQTSKKTVSVLGTK